MICPCGSKRDYNACCGRFHEGAALPETAQELMRSRYAAFATGKIDYLKETYWPKFQRGFDAASYAARAKNSVWLGLSISETEKGGPDDTTGIVAFTATSLVDGALDTHRERSLFRKKGGRWYYVEALAPDKTGSRR